MSWLSNHDSLPLPDADTATDDVSTDDPNTPPSIFGHLLPANFDKASFLTPPMIKYHQNEYDRPGYGLAYIEIAKTFLNYPLKRLGSISICVVSALLLHERMRRALV
jgi:hypothetical protein